MASNVRPITHTGITAEERRKRHRDSVAIVTHVHSPIESVNTVTASGATQTLPDVDVATMHDVTLTANCTFTFPAAGAGKSFSVRLTQDGTGSRTATWPAAVKWAAGTAPTLSTGAGKKDVLAFVCFDGSTWDGVLASKDSR